MVSFPSSLVGFLGFHPYMHSCFHSENFFVTCSCCFVVVVVVVVFVVVVVVVVLLFRNAKREER